MRNTFGIVLLISWILCSYTHASAPAAARADGRLLLKENWRIQPSTQVRADGKEISTAGFRADNWYSATVPSTVLAALVDAQVFLDPYYGLNLRSLPGATNPIGSEDFMLKPMPPESPFRSPLNLNTTRMEGKIEDDHFLDVADDNYFSLLPGERRELTATYRGRDLAGAAPVVEVEGWNVAGVTR